jgi:hypothetical protein
VDPLMLPIDMAAVSKHVATVVHPDGRPPGATPAGLDRKKEYLASSTSRAT